MFWRYGHQNEDSQSEESEGAEGGEGLAGAFLGWTHAVELLRLGLLWYH